MILNILMGRPVMYKIHLHTDLPSGWTAIGEEADSKAVIRSDENKHAYIVSCVFENGPGGKPKDE